MECIFRVSGKTPQLWDPKTGETKEILTYREENGQTIIPLHFEPEGSVFVVFKDGPVEKHIIAVQKDGKNWFPGNQFETRETPLIELYKQDEKKYAFAYEPGTYTLTWSDGTLEAVNIKEPLGEIELSGKWDINFDPKWGAPEKVKINELKSWTKFDDQGIKYYSGTARYIKSFSLTKKDISSKLMILDLGNVQEMASVKINGHQTQVMWSAPFSFNITPYIKEGLNTLEIEVVNLWPNRLIGDGKLPQNQRLTKTNINKFDGKDAENYLRESGLLGPVKINIINQYSLK